MQERMYPAAEGHIITRFRYNRKLQHYLDAGHAGKTPSVRTRWTNTRAIKKSLTCLHQLKSKEFNLFQSKVGILKLTKNTVRRANKISKWTRENMFTSAFMYCQQSKWPWNSIGGWWAVEHFLEPQNHLTFGISRLLLLRVRATLIIAIRKLIHCSCELFSCVRIAKRARHAGRGCRLRHGHPENRESGQPGRGCLSSPTSSDVFHSREARPSSCGKNQNKPSASSAS